MPAAARSPAQVEAARRNGAKSRGPVTDEGKARSRMNAIRHGLSAKEHLLLEGEDPVAWDELLTGLVSDIEPGTELEGRLVQRLASAIWRQQRADRLEQALFAAAPRPRYVTEGGFAHASPEEAFDLARMAAITRYRAEASREASRIMRELRALRDEPGKTAASSCRPPARPGGQPAGDEPSPNRPAASPDALPNDPEPCDPSTPPNRRERRRLAALTRKKAGRRETAAA